tara:strand:+ start:325 stop:654 length:330 start_codon:yes stop_codon:yes gene_type:complete
MDYNSDAPDIRADVTWEVLKKLKESSQLETVCLFKDYIIDEPEFIGINAISSCKLLDILYNPKKIKSKIYLSNYQLELFRDLSLTLFNKIHADEYYNTVCEQIFSIIYV